MSGTEKLNYRIRCSNHGIDTPIAIAKRQMYGGKRPKMVNKTDSLVESPQASRLPYLLLYHYGPELL